MAVDRGKRGVELYRIGQDRRAVLAVALRLPPGFRDAFAVTLSEGAHPDACVLWDRPSLSGGDAPNDHQLRCYAYGDTVGRVLPAGEQTSSIALRADGRAIVWVAELGESSDGEELVTARLDHGVLSSQRHYPTYRADGNIPAFGCGTWVLQAAWTDDDHLVLECSGENDQPGGLVVQRLAGKTAGGRPLDPPSPATEPGYDAYARPGAADAQTALVVEEASCDFDCGRIPPARAVRVDVASGRVLEVISTPLPGRYVTSVSGGPRGIVYVTQGSGKAVGTRVYLRLPGEKHGVLVTGLPSAVDEVVAQP